MHDVHHVRPIPEGSGVPLSVPAAFVHRPFLGFDRFICLHYEHEK